MLKLALWCLPALLWGLAAGPASAQRTPPSAQDRAIAPGDSIQITVVGEAELSRSATVNSDGTVSLGYPGKVRVAGLTPAAAAAEIRRTLLRYVRDPKVSVDMSQNRFSVLGAVRTPGQFTMEGDQISVLDALARAGGPEDAANLRQVTLVRNTAAGQQKTRLDVYEAIKGSDHVAAPMMQSGDVLYVDRRRKPIGSTLLTVLGAAASIMWVFR